VLTGDASGCEKGFGWLQALTKSRSVSSVLKADDKGGREREERGKVRLLRIYGRIAGQVGAQLCAKHRFKVGRMCLSDRVGPGPRANKFQEFSPSIMSFGH
jgi:hypothetical protein